MSEPLIELKNIKKSFGSHVVVENLSLTINSGEFITLLGPSGCGKTTILRMLAGFEMPDDGTILFQDKNLLSISANHREINTVFQSYALFPHLNVRDNVGFALRMKKVPKIEIERKVSEILSLTKLESLANRKPGQLSGGQQQRVAIARSLMNEPKVLLLDEPLGALDLQLRKQMQLELKRLQRKLGTTYIYVTHDQEEALTMSDRIVVMNAGKIEQIGTPEDIYYSPSTPFVAKFIGESNLLEGTSEPDGDTKYFKTEGVRIPIEESIGFPKFLSIRPEFIKLHTSKPQKECLEGTIEENTFLGEVNRIMVKLPSGNKIIALSENGDFRNGMKVYVNWNTNKTYPIY